MSPNPRELFQRRLGGRQRWSLPLVSIYLIYTIEALKMVADAVIDGKKVSIEGINL